ncbi:hypothetical protein ES703_102768 [subsurface metagenome]
MKNKAKVILLVIFFSISILFVSTVYAQEFKFIGGVNTSEYITGNPIFSLYSADSYYKWEYKSGFLIGAGFEFSLIKKMAIEVDVLYFQRGSKFKVTDVPNWESIYSLNMISFPILIKIKPFPRPAPYILGGGEFSFILSHQLKIIYEDNETENSISWKTKNINTGLVFGSGIEIRLLNFLIFIEGRYHLGLRDIEKEPKNWESLKTNSIVLIIGLKI